MCTWLLWSRYYLAGFPYLELPHDKKSKWNDFVMHDNCNTRKETEETLIVAIIVASGRSVSLKKDPNSASSD